ncbi:hypothetical protein TELCIR_10631, partial [Teladorsagia circumcincta]
NLWRAKQRSEISPNVSVEFARFAKHCKTTTSEDTGITYHYSPNGTVYPQAENFTLYFACDDTCCAMECCQRDIEMTIIGVALISISVFILGFYVSVYFGGLICAWRNGALGRGRTCDQLLVQEGNTTTTREFYLANGDPPTYATRFHKLRFADCVAPGDPSANRRSYMRYDDMPGTN